MQKLTARQAIWISALLACVVYATALRNQWALDDHGLIELNPAAHSMSAALKAAFSPYWPPQDGYSAGLYRPLVTLSYAIDWTLSAGRPAWFHLTNVLFHGLATALAVAVVLPWLPPLGALAAGVVFAIHPVHVEAVANVIGRAEILAAIGLLAAVLAARRYRRARARGERAAWLGVTLLAVAGALASKEHAVVALFVLGLDQSLDAPDGRRGGWDLYVGVAALTVAWLFLWRAIAGHLILGAGVVPLRELGTGARLSTVVQVQLEVLRLLVWPFRLAADYSPQTIPLRATWTVLATVAVITTTALIALAAALWRRAPALTFGILGGAATYLPTSNLLFVSGVVLAERALYLAALAPAVAAGWLLARSRESSRRWLAVAAAATVCIPFAVRTVTRIPFWRDSRSVVVQGFVEHPENFSNQIRVAEAFLRTGDSGQALAHYLTALELYDRYSFVPVAAGRLAFAMGRPGFALELGRRAWAITPGHPGTARFLSDVFLALHQPDSALAVTRDAAARNPRNPSAVAGYVALLERTGAPEWRRQLAGARLAWLEGRLAAATAAISAAEREAAAKAGDQSACWELAESLDMVRMLAPRDTLWAAQCPPSR